MPSIQGYPHLVASTDGGENLGKPGKRWGEVHAIHVYSYASGTPVEITAAGPPGDAGMSAYGAWIAEGNTGSPADFLASLNGKSAYQVWLDSGNTGTEAEFIASLKGADGTGTGDMLAATYDPIIKAITGESTVGATPDTTLAALWAQPWTLPCVLNNPADAYTSFSLPLSRNATMSTMDFYCTGTPSASTNIVVKQNGTTVGTVAISAAGKTTLTFSTAVTGTLDDVFTYTVSGAGLAACTVTANTKWVNR